MKCLVSFSILLIVVTKHKYFFLFFFLSKVEGCEQTADDF